MSEKILQENPLKNNSVRTFPGQTDDMIRRGGVAAYSIESPTSMRQEQKSPFKLHKHQLTGIIRSNN